MDANAQIQIKPQYQTYNEVIEDTPFTFTPKVAAVAEPLIRSGAFKWVTSYIIKVRSIGTATYIATGNSLAQEFRLTGVGQARSWTGNEGEVVDLTKLWIISDTNDAVLEVYATYLPLSKYGNVLYALSSLLGV